MGICLFLPSGIRWMDKKSQKKLPRYIYLEPFDDPCFDWSEKALFWGVDLQELEVIWVPGIYIYILKLSSPPTHTFTFPEDQQTKNRVQIQNCKGFCQTKTTLSNVCFFNVAAKRSTLSLKVYQPHPIHVWYIYLHLVGFYGKCR